MSAIVLYTDDMEAITVIDLPQWFLDRLHDGEYMRIPVPELPSVTAPETPSSYMHLKTVTIWAEKFVRRGRETFLLFTNDEEFALILRSDILPGQRKAFQEEYRKGFVSGLLRALG